MVEEFGYILFEAEVAKLIFQLLFSRDERASLIVTSNKSFGRGGEVCGDVAVAMIDPWSTLAELISAVVATTGR